MFAIRQKLTFSSAAVHHSDGVYNSRTRRVDHHAPIPCDSDVALATLERTSTAPLR
jgi:hypothetical protein